MNDDITQKIREKAYELWILEGRPEGREQVHWHMAQELVAQEHSSQFTLVPDVPAQEEYPESDAPPINLREEPDLSHMGEDDIHANENDQGLKDMAMPSRRVAGGM